MFVYLALSIVLQVSYIRSLYVLIVGKNSTRAKLMDTPRNVIPNSTLKPQINNVQEKTIQKHLNVGNNFIMLDKVCLRF